jgi:hypothetical protein
MTISLLYPSRTLSPKTPQLAPLGSIRWLCLKSLPIPRILYLLSWQREVLIDSAVNFRGLDSSSKICFFVRSLEIIGFLIWGLIGDLKVVFNWRLFGILPVHRENYTIDLFVFLFIINKLVFSKANFIFLHSLPSNFPAINNLFDLLWEFIIKVILQVNLELSFIDLNFDFFVSE